jgi:hypothetical protein
LINTILYIAPTYFGIILSSSMSWYQSSWKTYSNKIGHNKPTYAVVSIVQNITGFD